MGPTLAAGYWFRAAQTAGKGGRAVKYNQKPGAVDVLDARSLPGTRPGKQGGMQGVLRPVEGDGSGSPPLCQQPCLPRRRMYPLCENSSVA